MAGSIDVTPLVNRVFSHDVTAAMLGGQGKLEISIGLGMFGTALPA